MTTCCQMPAYLDPLYYDETNCRFAHYARCSSCHKLIGEAKIIYTAPKGLRDAWTALSEVAIREHHKDVGRDMGRPLRFVMSKAGLMPVGYQGGVKAQPELVDEESQF